jgi:hypothetical protein
MFSIHSRLFYLAMLDVIHVTLSEERELDEFYHEVTHACLNPPYAYLDSFLFITI